MTYRYPARTTPALADLNLTIEAGSTTAIVGVSGAGKSTLADLVLGLLRPDRGRVLIDDVALDPAHLPAWREQIGYVAQDTFLFHDTVRANMRWACPEATDADILEAFRQAAADRFVAALPQGLDTVLGDRGMRLSGGERQRLALARALLRKPSLLILDEATSALDSDNERLILQSIQALHGRVAIVIISHRLSTLRRRRSRATCLTTGACVESAAGSGLLAQPDQPADGAGSGPGDRWWRGGGGSAREHSVGGRRSSAARRRKASPDRHPQPPRRSRPTRGRRRAFTSAHTKPQLGPHARLAKTPEQHQAPLEAVAVSTAA